MDMSFTSMGSVGDWREFQSEAILGCVDKVDSQTA
jgi:hypothetical protein